MYLGVTRCNDTNTACVCISACTCVSMCICAGVCVPMCPRRAGQGDGGILGWAIASQRLYYIGPRRYLLFSL